MASKKSCIAAVLTKSIFILVILATVCPSTIAAKSTSSLISPSPDSESGLYRVEIQRGQRRTISGTERSYTLYLPQPTANLPGPPYPLLVIAHGFLMSGTQQSANSLYFAKRGIAVLSPNLTRVLWGDKNRVDNIKDVIDQLCWVKQQNASKKSGIYGMIDENRIGIAGNSSGGAVALETLVQAQIQKVPIHAFCSMDGAPWDKSWSYMPKLTPLKVLSLRAEPSICNEHARMLNFLRSTTFSFDDIKIIGAHHCDAENPTTVRCECICGKSRGQYRELFQRMTYLFFRDAFGVPRIDGPNKSLLETARDLEGEGKVTAHLNQQGSTKVCGIHDRPEDERNQGPSNSQAGI
jgi:hypothetical protein